MELRTVGELLQRIPMRYEHELAEGSISAASDAAHEDPKAHLCLRGEITRIQRTQGRKPRIQATLEDSSGVAHLVWFNQGWVQRKLHPGMEVLVTGKGTHFHDQLQLINPRFEMIDPDAPRPEREAGKLRPIYPASEAVTSARIERLILLVLDAAVAQIEDPLTDEYRESRSLLPLAQAWRFIHAPDTTKDVQRARHRLAFDELLLLQLGVMMRRFQLRDQMHAPALRWDDELDARIRARFPFPLSGDQATVVREIAADLATTTPMNRLLQGDVGAGKTVVALYGMLAAAASSHQAALMAPTEILAEQHFASIAAMLENSDVSMTLLTGSLPEPVRRERLQRIEAGEIDLVIGTHALFTESVAFKSLAFVVIDEQHRFGVVQRAALRAKAVGENAAPHVLVMTATPIPRTLSLTVFGDLDVSTIPGRLPGRTPPITRVVGEDKRDAVYGHLAERLARSEQAFIVVPAIDESDSGLKNVETFLPALREGALREFSIEAMHGRLTAEERGEIMSRFRAGAIDALVATVVIEVGVDIHNATMMVIEDAERFGLAQLHQLRGRVGRGEKQGVCALIGHPSTDEGRLRLESISASDDGFEIAERDLAIRGPGELFGQRQSGLPPFLIADLMRDLALLKEARADAAAWIERSPNLAAPEEAILRSKLMGLYGEALGIGDVG